MSPDEEEKLKHYAWNHYLDDFKRLLEDNWWRNWLFGSNSFDYFIHFIEIGRIVGVDFWERLEDWEKQSYWKGACKELRRGLADAKIVPPLSAAVARDKAGGETNREEGADI